MSTQVRQPGPMNGLLTLWNVVVAPSAAFKALREQPTWVAAFLVAAFATVVASIVMQPAIAHALTVSLPAQMAKDPNSASLTAEQRQRVVAVALAFVRFGWIFNVIVSLVTVFVAAVVLWAIAAIGRGEVNFARIFALTMNVSVIWLALGQLVAAGIVAGRGPDSFNAAYEISFAVPNLGWLAPGAPPKVLGFLAGINPFSIWAFALLGSGMTIVAKVKPIAGYLGAAFLVLLGCGFLALGVR